MEFTILMPCLNEAETISHCVTQAQRFLHGSGIEGEVLVADNGSTDGSQDLASQAGARVIHVAERGYGSALRAGIAQAGGRYVIMGDADASYDFSSLGEFVTALRAGHQLVIGNRFAGGIQAGAMPALHRYLGNPVLSFVGRLFFRSPIRDFHCGLRGFERAAVLGLRLAAPGMEFASEMVVKATLAKLRIAEVPTKLWPDGRSRAPHLRSWRDGWRHLRFLLLMSPRWLLLYPGLTLAVLGLVLQGVIWSGPVIIGGVGFDIHTMLYASAMSILGLQLVIFSLLARAVGSLTGLLPASPWFQKLMSSFSLERGIVLGLLVALIGLGLSIYSVLTWMGTGLSALDPTQMMRLAIPATTLMLFGAEIVFASFILSFMGAASFRAS
ncbi:MAG: glycosyltransferase family 2 protein [Aquabacterium sp.]|nr:glycosyltransferase family 2 protein [Aquabacterium sp.]